MKKDELYSFLEENQYYNVLLSVLALVTGLESVFQFSFDKEIVPEWFDSAVFWIFLADLLCRVGYYVYRKAKDPRQKYSGLFSVTFTLVDVVALFPDIIHLVLGTTQLDLKAIRALRAFKLLRLTRVFSRNRQLLVSVVNFFRYRLYGQGLVLGANGAMLVVFGGIFSFVHYEHAIYMENAPILSESMKWGLEIFTEPYGGSFKDAQGGFLKTVAFLGSTLGLFVYASIVGVLSNTYKGVFEIIDRGVGMTSVKKNDFVIIGWNHLIPNLVEHITTTNKQRAVLVAGLDKMRVRDKFDTAGQSHVYNGALFDYVMTDYSCTQELEKLQVWNAEKIIVVYDEAIAFVEGDIFHSGNARDAKLLFTMKTVREILRGREQQPKIMCEVFCKENKRLFADYPEVEIISKESLFSNVFSQSVIQDEILNVYKRLLKTEDKELYVVPFHSEHGRLSDHPSEYYEHQASLSKMGIGVVGLYFKSTKGAKPRVILSPSESELKTAVDLYENGDYTPNFVLLAEDPKEVEKIQKAYRKKVAA